MCCGYQILLEETLVQVYDVDLHGGQRSSEVKCDKPCAMATKFSQKKPWYKFMKMMTFIEFKGHQRSNVANLCNGYQIWSEETLMQFKMMMTFMEVKGHQRSNVFNFALWLLNLVRRIPDVHLWWIGDNLHAGQRSSEVKSGKLCAMITKHGQKNPWCKHEMMMTFIEVKGHQR